VRLLRLALVLVVAVGLMAVLVLILGNEDGPARRDPAPSLASSTTDPSTTTVVAAPTRPASSSSTVPRTSTTVASPVAPASVVDRGDPSRRTVALTFDAGSDTGYTSEILDVLAREDVVATFGITGRWARENPALVRRMDAEGHQVVNHGDQHRSFTGVSTGEPPLTQAERLAEVAGAEGAIEATGVPSPAPWFRPPYGDVDQSVRRDLALAGYRYVLMWTVDSLGWRGAPPTEVVQRCLDGASPGAIYLFHVGADSTDHAALERIVDGLRDRGYGFQSAAQLVQP
jgi:peptidoglycan/xylan/chitin deacetylase (PgdA/CDA1 family)